MTDFDFLNLSPPEFEALTRDIISAWFKVDVKNYAEGRDNGIDLKFTDKEGKICIVQCKRYEQWSNLFSTLKKEVAKIELNVNDNIIKFDKYYIATSVDLTEENEKEIVRLFSSFITDEKNIFSRKVLNRELSNNHKIIEKHFKLWLANIDILNHFLNKKIVNQTYFEQKEIDKLNKIYVVNDSLSTAIEIVNKNHYVIISGNPGSGKTTLGRILVSHYIQNGFEEFIFLTNSISEGYDMLQEGRKQIILFDDFLGRNFFVSRLITNDENNIIRLINKVKNSDDKILILTTREYILNQAKLQYDVFENECLNIKFFIDLRKTTQFIKAKILYNHLYFSGIPQEYIDNLKLDYKEMNKVIKGYEYIINHRNYNPRTIEQLTDEKHWNKIEPSNFFEEFKKNLINPHRIWKHAYENQISNESRIILSILSTLSSRVEDDLLFELFENFGSKFGIKYKLSSSYLDFDKSLKELHNTFITTNETENDTLMIDFQNPAIQDFLIENFNERNSKHLIKHIFETALFIEQFVSIFSFGSQQKNKVQLDKQLENFVIQIITEKFDELRMLNKNKLDYINDLNFLNNIISCFNVFEHQEIKEKLVRKISNFDINTDIVFYYTFLNCLIKFRNEIQPDLIIIKKHWESLESIDDINTFSLLFKLFPDEFDEFYETNIDEIHDKFSDIISEELHKTNDYDTITDLIKEVDSNYCTDFYSSFYDIIDEYKDQKYHYDYPEDMDYSSQYSNIYNSENSINELFNTLNKE